MSIKDLIELFRVKPILLLSTVIALGYWLGLSAESEISWVHILVAVIAPCVAASGAFALNQFYEWKADAQMERTKARPIPSGRIHPQVAHLIGYTVFVGALILQWNVVSVYSAIATALCGLSYIWLYTPLKNWSVYSSLFGAIPGMLLPLIGWFSVQDDFSGMVVWMAVMLLVWQIPHTLTICYRHRVDYQNAGFKQLPFVHGNHAAFKQMVWWTIMKFPLVTIPFAFGDAGWGFLIAAVFATGVMTYFVVRFSKNPNDSIAKRFFFVGLAYLPVLFISVILNSQ